MDATLEARHLSALKDHLVTASSTVNGVSAKAVTDPAEEQAIFDDVCESQYTSKIRSYAQSMNFIRTAAALKVLAIRELFASMIVLSGAALVVTGLMKGGSLTSNMQFLHRIRNSIWS